MYIIVGLGNPTKEYQKTRHNVGFEVIDRLAKEYNIDVTTIKHKAMCGKGMIGGEKVILAKPLTYMNLSGESVRELAVYYKVEPTDIIVVFDDISLDVGKLRLRNRGSAGGHNGIKSIIANLKSEEFKRVRVGIGDKPKGSDLADYVLGRFSGADAILMDEAYDKAAAAIAKIINDGIEAAMNQYN